MLACIALDTAAAAAAATAADVLAMQTTLSGYITTQQLQKIVAAAGVLRQHMAASRTRTSI
jgi:hypothetical protein